MNPASQSLRFGAKQEKEIDSIGDVNHVWCRFASGKFVNEGNLKPTAQQLTLLSNSQGGAYGYGKVQ
jgi:hypothetical protein